MIHAKRILIVGLFVISLFVLDFITGDTLWLNKPSTQDIEETIEALLTRQEAITDAINTQLDRDPLEDFNTLFDHSVRHTFIIEFTQDEFDGLNEDMWTYYEMFGTFKSNNYRNVDVTYVADDDVQIIEDVGFRSKGNIYSRRPPLDEYGNVQNIHFMLKFNETFDYYEGESKYNELKTREFANVEQILFKWNNTGDPSYMNEVFSYDSFTTIGVVVPEASFAEVVIVVDGKVELRSLYNIFEHFDEEFIRRAFSEDNSVGDLYKVSWSGTLMPIGDSELYGVRDWKRDYRPIYAKETNKDTYSYRTLIDFSYGINDNNIDQQRQFFEDNFNIDSFIRAMSLNVLLGNPDDYRGNGNNFYYYFDEDGYMTYIPFDYDNSVGSGWTGEPAFIDFTLGNDIYEWGHFDWVWFEIPLWDNLIQHEDIQILYENYMEEFILDGTFSEASYLETFDIIDSLYGDDFQLIYDKTYFINTKISRVLDDIDYYRNKRN